MINLDERYHDYLTNPTKKFRIDGVGEKSLVMVITVKMVTLQVIT